nr:glycosyltransferase family 2 protein [Diaminobutyricimonas sp. LJ205]
MQSVSLPQSASPRVSVIVLAWRLVDELLECLSSLAAVSTTEVEVIVVLNGAEPAVRAAVRSQVHGAREVNLEANIGFGGGCNAGAAAARGEYLVFLNDDAQVEPGMLAALMRGADADPSVGGVAAVLLHPDGSLQEAGSRVLRTAGTVQLGAGMDLAAASDAGLLTRREIDYGSGAALLILKRAFESVDGYDPIYEPAYFEDVDLAFRLKAAGWKIILEPEARAIHASGASTSRDRRFQTFASERSGAAFIDRWARTLESAPEADDPLEKLCQVVPGEAPQRAAESVGVTQTAVQIAQDYSTWLVGHLDALEEEHARTVRDLAECRTTAEAAQQRVRELEARAHELDQRLRDLESRGPVGIIKWQGGILRRRLRERRGQHRTG